MPLFKRRRTLSDDADTFSDIEPVVFKRLRDDPQGRPWHFLSLRWKIIAPLALSVLIVGMLGSYLVGHAIATEADARKTEDVLDAAEAVTARLNDLSAAQQREVTRIAYTQGVPDLVAAGDVNALHNLLEPLAAAADLDYVLIADPQGVEIIGLQRVTTGTGATDYAVATGTDLTVLLDSAPALGGTEATIRAALARTGQEHALLTAGPIMQEEARIGTVIVGTQTGRLLDALQGGDGADLALFGAAGEFVRTTLPFDEQTRDALTLTPELYRQALTTPGQVPIATLTLNDRPHHAAYVPLVVGGTPLGVLGIYVEDDTLPEALASQETLGLLFASLVGLVIVIAFTTIGSFTRRVERVTTTANAIASGDLRARTGMRPGDEIGELGATLDRMADRQQRRTESLHDALRKERADSARLIAVLESIPDGIVVQDLDGRVLLINDAARTLLGGQRVFRAKRLHELTAVVTEKLGPALAPGIYALGDPTRVPLEGKMLQAQAAAIVVKPGQRRLGTVIVLRDITDEVRREQAREQLLDRLADEAVVPTSPEARSSLAALAREFVRNARAMQSVIAELRDLSTFEPRDLQTGQRPLAVNDLIWNITAEWEPLARAAKIRLNSSFGPRGQLVLGDDRRLRWAIGNLIDNALKYSPPRTVITLQARISDTHPEHAEIVIEDQGCGIAPEDLAKAFTRFYRGTPRDRDGKRIRKPGTGQGLYIARRVVQAHGGEIALASREGLGTTAIVRLPLTADVALELPAQGGEPGGDTQPIELSHDDGYDTVPLEPHKRHRQRRRDRG